VSETLPLGVDLCLQDNYFDPGNSPVDGETWHYWLETWLGYLSDYLPVAAGYELSLRLCGDSTTTGFNTKSFFGARIGLVNCPRLFTSFGLGPSR